MTLWPLIFKCVDGNVDFLLKQLEASKAPSKAMAHDWLYHESRSYDNINDDHCAFLCIV